MKAYTTVAIDCKREMNATMTKTAKFLMFLLMLLLSFGICAVFTAIIDGPPSNTSVILGNDATLRCSVLYQEEETQVIWRKVNGGSDLLSLNNRSVTTKKYEVEGTYHLMIKDTELEDEGEYECDTGEESVRVSLTVLVLMQNMTVSWGVPVPFDVGRPVNITCRAINSRPVASLRWYRGVHDITHLATSLKTTTRANGFGDTVSTIGSVVVSEDVPFRCIADLPGHPAVRTEFLFPPVISTGHDEAYSICTVMLLYVVFVTVLPT